MNPLNFGGGAERGNSRGAVSAFRHGPATLDRPVPSPRVAPPLPPPPPRPPRPSLTQILVEVWGHCRHELTRRGLPNRKHLSSVGATVLVLAGGHWAFPSTCAAFHMAAGRADDNQGDEQAAIGEYTQVIALQPRTAEGYVRRARAYYTAFQYGQAIADETQVQRLTDDPQVRADSLMWRGYDYDLSGDHAWGITDFTASLAINARVPDTHVQTADASDKTPDAHKGRLWAYWRSKQYGLAARDCDALIAADGSYAGSYLIRGRLRCSMGDMVGARADFEAAYGRAPRLLPAYLNLEDMLEKQGQPRQALDVARAALRANPSSAVALGTFRNPLLHYRALRSRGVEVVDADPQAVFQALVHDGKHLPFRAKPDPVAAPSPTQPRLGLTVESDEGGLSLAETLADELPAVPAGSLDTDSTAQGRTRARIILQTASSPTDLQKRLLNTYYTSKSFIEEQGINTLFLVLGMLTWYEADSSQEARRSPLVLVPVDIDRGDASAPFHLSFRDEEIGENLSLATLLRQDFGITLPELPDAHDLDVTAYCAQVGTAVRAQARWAVDASAVSLGFFSFSKFLMFKDLDEKSWPESQKPSEHALMQALLGGGFREEEPRYSAQDQLDQSVTPADTYTVVDADSSQALAVLDVNQGRNLVIQGPPGTGKSQTITNIIAEAVGRGRRVLFVSEKQAALEVVKGRLDRLELGNACLELHCNKSNKKVVLGELKRTMDMDRPVLGSVEDNLNLLVGTRERLNRYCEAVNAPVGRSGLTLHDVLGEWLLFQNTFSGVELPRLDLGDTTAWTSLDFRRRDALVAELQAHLAAMGTPQAHPFWGSGRATFLPSDAGDLRRLSSTALGGVQGLSQAARALAASLGLPAPTTIQDADVLAQAVLRACAAPEHDGMRFSAGEWLSRRADLERLLGLGERVAALRAQYDAVLLPEAWDADVLNARAALLDYGPKWWRFLSGDWRAARKRLASLCRQVPPARADQQVTLLDAILELRQARKEFDKRQALGATLFGAQWEGERSRWEVLRRLLDWIAELQQQVGGGRLPKAFLDFLTGSSDLTDLEPQAGAVTSQGQAVKEDLAKVVQFVELREALRFGTQGGLAAQPLPSLEAVLSQWAASPHLLQQMVQFNGIAQQCRAEGLESVAALAASQPDPTQIVPAFRRTWYLNLMRKGLMDNPHLASFNSASHEKAIEQFRALDTRLLGHNRARLAQRHWDDLPSGRGDGQVRVLTREFEKKARHMPLRKLLSEAGRAVQAIKPVFMMSPLSVAAYLVPGDLEFDLVVFDEASQVKPVDAFGALLRGRQAVVVGDSKQLPPTNFFDALTGADGDDDEELNVTQDLESVLGMFVAQESPQRMLRWHYRSRHESLIAVSNQEFYDNGLVIFPSPDAAREHLGLRYRHLPETVYDRGRSGTNPKEAAAVADAVMAHAQSQVVKPPSERLTLGVAAFSVAQMQTILDQLEVRRRQTPASEPFFNTSAVEPFFVKNLENVQGDERDIIYISLGYGRDASGKVSMNFGPLNGRGGERRLNVLITRAPALRGVHQPDPRRHRLEQHPVPGRQGPEALPGLCALGPARPVGPVGARARLAVRAGGDEAAPVPGTPGRAAGGLRGLLYRHGRGGPRPPRPLHPGRGVRRGDLPQCAVGAGPRPPAGAGAARPGLEAAPHLEHRLHPPPRRRDAPPARGHRAGAACPSPDGRPRPPRAVGPRTKRYTENRRRA